MAFEENAKRPGFDARSGAPRWGLKSYGTGIAYAPGAKTMVVLNLEIVAGASLSLMLPTDQAEELGNKLIRDADNARRTTAPPGH